MYGVMVHIILPKTAHTPVKTSKLRDYCPNMYTVIIGHAVNDSISTGGGSNSTEETPPGDFLANRMICFMAQGLSQDFHHVRYFLGFQ